MRGLEPYADDAAFRADWRDDQAAEQGSSWPAYIDSARRRCRWTPDSIFDVMVKRLHEYKRQLLKVLHIITLYQPDSRPIPSYDMSPRTFIFGAKAAPGYHMAKLIIKLINCVATSSTTTRRRRRPAEGGFSAQLQRVLAESIYPAADISEQISLAGKEASGTGNMKFALNGALTVGTLDGANIEIRERVGAGELLPVRSDGRRGLCAKGRRLPPDGRSTKATPN